MSAYPDIVRTVTEHKAAQYRTHPCHTNRASSLGGDCERELVYQRLHWDRAAEPSDDLKIIFQEGEKHEQAVIQDMRDAGLRVFEQQTTLHMREYQITGHIDATVGAGPDMEPVPVDVKSMSPHIWDSIFYAGADSYTWEQVAERFQAKPWLRKYRGQITLYMLMREIEHGILLCINKGTGALAQVCIDLDYTYGESLLQRAERINLHVEAETLPERIEYDEEICPRCPFYHLCLPSQQDREPIAFLSEPKVIDLLTTWGATREAAADYRRADEKVKAWAKAQESDRIAIGDWLVQVKKQRNGKRVEIREITHGG
jgi:hypothetical protein